MWCGPWPARVRELGYWPRRRRVGPAGGEAAAAAKAAAVRGAAPASRASAPILPLTDAPRGPGTQPGAEGKRGPPSGGWIGAPRSLEPVTAGPADRPAPIRIAPNWDGPGLNGRGVRGEQGRLRAWQSAAGLADCPGGTARLERPGGPLAPVASGDHCQWNRQGELQAPPEPPATRCAAAVGPAGDRR